MCFINNQAQCTFLFLECFIKEKMMNKKILKVALAGLVLSVCSFANAGIITVDAFNSGAYESNGSHNNNQNINTTSNRGSWLAFDLSGVSEQIVSATLEVWSDSRNDTGQAFSWWDVSTPYASFNSGVNTSIYKDLISGTVLASGIHEAGQINSFIMNASAIVDLNLSTGTWLVGGNNNDSGNAFGWTNGVDTGDTLRLILETGQIPETSVPEPSTLAIFALGIIGLASRRFKKQ